MYMWNSQSTGNIVPTTDASLSNSNSLTLTHISFSITFPSDFLLLNCFAVFEIWSCWLVLKRICIDFWDEWILWVFLIPLFEENELLYGMLVCICRQKYHVLTAIAERAVNSTTGQEKNNYNLTFLSFLLLVFKVIAPFLTRPLT